MVVSTIWVSSGATLRAIVSKPSRSVAVDEAHPWQPPLIAMDNTPFVSSTMEILPPWAAIDGLTSRSRSCSIAKRTCWSSRPEWDGSAIAGLPVSRCARISAPIWARRPSHDAERSLVTETVVSAMTTAETSWSASRRQGRVKSSVAHPAQREGDLVNS